MDTIFLAERALIHAQITLNCVSPRVIENGVALASSVGEHYAFLNEGGMPWLLMARCL